MHDQADQLRQLVRATLQADAALAPGGPVVAVSGSRAGVGATAVACALAGELAKLGKQVILVDACLQHTAAIGPNPRRLPPTSPDLARAGLRQASPEAAERYPTATAALAPLAAADNTLADVLSGRRRAVEALVPTRLDGLRLLPGCRRQTPQLNRHAVERFATELAALAPETDALVIDAGHGMNAWIDRLWQLARQVLVVATPESQTFLDAYATVKHSQHQRLADKLRLVLNRTADEELATLDQRFSETCQRFLSLAPKPAAALPAWRPAAGHVADTAFTRAVRLLAADIACDFRVASLRLLRPNAGRKLPSQLPS